jgi:Ca-activated chloride channel family protein
MAPGDRVALARQDAGVWDWSACADADQGTAASLQTPSAPGGYELRYLSGRSGQVLARVPVELYRVPARIHAPEEVVAGRPLEIRWEGPDDRTDFVTVVPAGAPEGTYRAFAPTSSGSPVVLSAPSEPGSYEIRYVAGASEATLASRPLEVVPVEVTLQVPPRARAGGRIEVRWTGPAGSDDTITVALPDWPPQRSADWAYATMGNPISLAAPDEPGTYEVRYVEGGSRSILARAPIKVQ